MDEWEAEIHRLEKALTQEGKTWPEKRIREAALHHLIVETLLAQAAAREGHSPTPEEVQERLDQLAEEAGGTEALTQRVTRWGYPDLDAFRQALARAMAATWMRDHLLEQNLPAKTEHVEVRQILLYSAEEAQQALALLQQGTEFETLARSYDPVTGGYLGWMPRRVWPTQEMEEAVFALEPGAYSPVLTSPLGYHIVYVIAREERDLAPWSRRIWSRQVLEDWLRRAWEQGRVEILVPGIEVHPALQP